MNARAPALFRFGRFVVLVLALGPWACARSVEPAAAEGHAQVEPLVTPTEALDAELTSARIALEGAPVRLGLLWDAPTAGAVEVRLLRDAGWGSWERPTVVFAEAGAFAGHVDAEGAIAFQWRASGAAARPTYFYAEAIFSLGEGAAAPPVEPAPTPGGALRQALQAFPNILPRSAWGARAPKCVSSTAPYRVAIHHTVTPTPDGQAPEVRLREIQAYHMDSRDYCDIAYNYLVSQDGRVWTGRGATVLGGHTLSQNTGNVGISYIGTFSTIVPSIASRCSGAGLLAWLTTNYPAVSLNSTDVKGHRDWPGQSTECPGNAFHPLLGDLISKAINGCGPANTPPRGSFDLANCDSLAGWAQDPDVPNQAINVHLYFGGQAGSGAPGLSILADLSRADLCTAINSCKHGFDRRPPLSLLDGAPRDVFMYGIDSAGGTNPLLAKKSLDCAFVLPKGEKRHVSSQTVLDAWKLSRFTDIAPTTDAILAARADGLTWPSTPRMVRGTGATAVWLVDNGFRRHVQSRAIAAAWRLDLATVVEKPAADVLAMPLGPPLRAEPVLAKGTSPAVYVIDDALPDLDAGTPPPVEPDAGVLELDGGVPPVEELDGGTPQPESDGGTPPPDGEESSTPLGPAVGGCGCQSASGAVVWLALALGGLARRTRREPRVRPNHLG